MKYFIFLFIAFMFSCGPKPASETDSLKDESVTQTSSFGIVKVESIITGKEAKDYWNEGLQQIEYNIFRHDSLLTTISISREEFVDWYENRTFSTPSRIWQSEILAVDDQRGLIAITNSFGPPNSDNLTNVIVVSDFKGNKTLRDSPLSCSTGTTVSFNKIIDCNGVYDFNQPIIEYKECCTVFSGLLNESTLFYLKNTTRQQGRDNAFLININTKDTLDHFTYRDITEALTYSALVTIDKQMGLLVVLQLDRNEIIIWDQSLKKKTYSLSDMKSVKGLIPIGDYVEMYNEELGQILIEFDKSKKPTRWNQ